MDFATDYKDFVTFLYYVISLSLQILVFVVGTIYLNWRERKQREKDQLKDKKEKEQGEKEQRLQREKEQRKQELREWRQFSEIINMEYIRLKSNGVLQRVQGVLDSIKQIRIFRNFGGLDVLRYMIDDVQQFRSRELEKLLLDLDSIFIQLNHCWSLCSLGEVPNQFVNGQLGRVVSELGQLTLPFFQGHRNKIVMECLGNFIRNGQTIQDNSRGLDLEKEALEKEVPYVKYFRFGVENQSYFATRTPLTLNVNDLIFNITDATKEKTLKFLNKLNHDLNDIPYATSFVTKLRAKIAGSRFLWIEANGDDEMIVNLLHEVRCYIWKGIEEDYDTKLKHNIKQLEEVSTELAQEGSQQQSRMAKVVMQLSERLLHELQNYLNGKVRSNPKSDSKYLIELIERNHQEMQGYKKYFP